MQDYLQKYYVSLTPHVYFVYIIHRVVGLWRGLLGKVNEKAASSLADPAEYENLFPGLKEGLKTQQYLKPQRQRQIPAGKYALVPVSLHACLTLSPLQTALV